MFDALDIRRENRDHAKANAAQAARLLESDREAVRQDTLRGDLMRRRRELMDELSSIESALDELDTLRILETRT
jgi:hypothetical protein